MLVTFYCDHCEAKLRITADAMGSPLVCPECDNELDVPNMSLGPGFVVGGFLIKHKLGEGGMGEVYLATQLSLERDVALKILPSRFTRERSFIVRFLKEVHYQARLDHPNVVATFDAGEDSGVYYMAMAYMDGETLEERLDRDGPLTEKAALQVIRQVALALQYAFEEKGLLHRDIKPGNIMVTPSQHAKVLDMGLSKNTLEKASSTLADTLIGTPNYMSPEQIDHPQDLDTRSDMFSLGMTLYHMLTGLVPYEETSYLKTLKRHASEPLEDPRKCMPGISQHTVYFLARLLARSPSDRYATWDELLQELHGVMSQNRLPRLPEGDSTLDVDPKQNPSSKIKKATSKRTKSERERTPRGIWVSVLVGMGVGTLSVLVFGMVFPRNPASAPMTPAPTPLVTPEMTEPLPVATAVPTEIPVEFQQELARLILEYESGPRDYDQMISDLVALGLESKGTSVSEEAALQIVRVRRDRDQALKKEQDRIRRETLELLYKQGGNSARSYLKTLETPFAEELQQQIGNLRRRIRIVEQQKKEQRESELAAAKEKLEESTREVASFILNREGVAALEAIDNLSKDPALFPVAEDVADLRNEVSALQQIPEQVLADFNRFKESRVRLQLQDRVLDVTVKMVNSDGLDVERFITDESGKVMGSVELDIGFFELHPNEILSRLEVFETPAADIFRGLMAHRNGEQERCREALLKADTPLADALRNEIFALPTLDMFDN